MRSLRNENFKYGLSKIASIDNGMLSLSANNTIIEIEVTALEAVNLKINHKSLIEADVINSNSNN